MRKAFLLAVILGGAISLYTTEASAVVCARGVHAAGCVGPRGAVVARRPVVRPRGAVVRSSTTVNRRRGTVTHRRTTVR